MLTPSSVGSNPDPGPIESSDTVMAISTAVRQNRIIVLVIVGVTAVVAGVQQRASILLGTRA